MKATYVLVISLAVLGTTLAAAAKPHLTAGTVDHRIVVDGQEGDWSGSLQPFGDRPFSVQVENDAAFLYLRLAASTPAVRREIMRLGMTVWFDPKGGTKKVFGIRYPVVEDPYDRGDRRGASGGHERDEPRGQESAQAESPQNPEPPDRVDVLGPGKHDARSLTRDHLDGIEVAARMDGDLLVYELKVPIGVTPEHPYALGVSPGETIGIGFETPKVEPPGSGGHGGFEGRGYGHGGYGGGHGGGGYGGSGGEEHREFQQAKPLNAWGLLTLR